MKMDIVSKKKRSKMMSNIRDRNTKPELLLRKHLHSLGIRFRLNQKIHGIKPDLVLKKYQTCIFVHGCFWHRHPDCKLASNPKSNSEFWEKKFATNILRDERNIAQLQAAGWQIGVVWECAVRSGEFRKFDFDKAFRHLTFWELSGIP